MKRLWIACLFAAASAPAAAAPPLGVGVAWEPISALSDEFNTQHVNPRGDGLDDSKWWDDHPRWSGRLPSQFAAPNSNVEGGYLKLRATSRVTSISQVSDQREQHWIDTAAIVSKIQAQVGGYYEASIKVANISLPSAFWFRMNSKSEIDVIENIGNPSNPGRAWKRSSMSYNTHFYNPPPDIAEGGNAPMIDENGDPLIAAENFVTYAVWWKSPQEILFYYNDIEVANVTPGGPFDEGLHMIFDMEAFHWEGFPSIADLNDSSKNTMWVDWVRSYRTVELQAGDYNADGTVDTLDYDQWLAEYGRVGSGLGSDGNGDGRTDAADYPVWRDAYDAAQGLTAVPEPSSAALFGMAAAAIHFRRFRFFVPSDSHTRRA